MKDLKVIQPGNAAGQVWSTRYVNFLKALDPDTIRGDGHGQDQRQHRRRAGRTARKPTDATYNEHGVPWEHVIALANELGANIWVPVPARANDDYVRQLAALVKANLNPELDGLRRVRQRDLEHAPRAGQVQPRPGQGRGGGQPATRT